MINRDSKTVYVISFSSGKDKYGKPNLVEDSRREIEMMMTIYKQNNVEDIRFIDATHIGLTADQDITDKNNILFDGIEYKVLFVIPSRRLTQVFLKKVL